jgi:hypothetical protein
MTTFGRITVSAILCVISLSLFSEDSFAQRWADGPVVVYEQRDGRGRSESFNVGEYRFNRNEFGRLRNDSAASVYVAAGYQVRLCDSEGWNGQGGGNCEEYGPGNHNLRYRNTASYISVWGGSGGGWGGGDRRRDGVTVYEDRDQRGNFETFDVGTYANNAGQLGRLGNDRASSIEVDRGYRVRLCDSEGWGNGGGRCEEYGEGRYNLRYSDTASFIEVRRGAGGGWGGGRRDDPQGFGRGVTVFDDRDFRGNYETFEVGRYLNNSGGLSGIGNDRASSIIVDPGYSVRLCENEGFGDGGGRCEEYGPGRFNLRYNDTASYIEVRRGSGGGWGGGNGGWGGGNRGGVVVFTDVNQRGNFEEFGVGIYRNDRGGLGRLPNDMAASIIVPAGLHIRLCENEGGSDGSGRCEDYGPGRYNLRYPYTASYIRVSRGGF